MVGIDPEPTLPARAWGARPWSRASHEDWLCGNVTDADGEEVCTAFCQSPNECRHDHNVDLILMAPEMADALIDLSGYLQSMGNCHGPREENIIRLSRELLAIGNKND